MGADQRALRGWRGGEKRRRSRRPQRGAQGPRSREDPAGGRGEVWGLRGSEGASADKPPCSLQAVKRFLISQPPGEEGR